MLGARLTRLRSAFLHLLGENLVLTLVGVVDSTIGKLTRLSLTLGNMNMIEGSVNS